MSISKFIQSCVCFVIRGRKSMSEFRPKGKFKLTHIRAGKVIGEYDVPNGIVDVGLNHILETEFNGGSQVTTWYLGLIDNDGYTALDDGDTMASHAGWAESADYDEATRPEWTAGTASGREITNAAVVAFTMNATVTIKGLFVTTNNTKDGTTGTLWATAAFGSTVAVNDNDVLNLTYTVSG